MSTVSQLLWLWVSDRKWWNLRSSHTSSPSSIMQRTKWWYVLVFWCYDEVKHTSVRSQLPTLRTLGNIVTGNDAQTQAVLNAGILQFLPALLHHDRPGIVRVSAVWSAAWSCHCTTLSSEQEAVWTLSNILAGSKIQIQVRNECEIGLYSLSLMHCHFFVPDGDWCRSGSHVGPGFAHIRVQDSEGSGLGGEQLHCGRWSGASKLLSIKVWVLFANGSCCVPG